MKEALYVVGWVVAMVASIAAIETCTPQERAAFDRGVLIGDAACVFAAKCAGLAGYADLSDFCRISTDAVKAAEAQLGDAFCPLPEKDAGHE